MAKIEHSLKHHSVSQYDSGEEFTLDSGEIWCRHHFGVKGDDGVLSIQVYLAPRRMPINEVENDILTIKKSFFNQ